MPPERRQYALAALPRHLASCAQIERLRFLLSHFDYLQAKLDAVGISPLIADYERLTDPVAPSIHRALQKASHILEAEPSQLWPQLFGRLMTSRDPDVRQLLAPGPPERPWLRPLGPTLEQASGPLRRTIPTHGGALRAVVVTPDGEIAVTGSVDHSIKVWNLARGSEIQTLHGHRATVNKLALTADGRRLLSASQNGEVRLWDLVKLRKVAVLTGPQEEVVAIAVTPDGNRALISRAGDPCIQVWDIGAGHLSPPLRGHGGEVGALAMAPDGRLCASASEDGTLRVWDLQRGETLHILEGHQKGKKIIAIAWAREGRLLVSVSWDQTLRLWDLAGQTAHRVFPCAVHVMRLAVSDDGRRAVTAEWNQEIWLWDLETGTVLARLMGHTQVITGIAMTPDGKCAVSVGGGDRELRVWDLRVAETGGGPPEALSFPPVPVQSVSLDAAGKRAVSAALEGDLSFWDAEACRRLSVVKDAHRDYVWSVAQAAAGNVAISSCEDGTLKIWDVATSRELRCLHAHTENIISVTISQDGRWAASASLDKSVKVWSVEEGREIQCLPIDDLAVSVAFLNEGRCVAVATVDGGLRVLDLRSTQQVWMYDGVGLRSSLLAASEEKNLLAFVVKGEVQIWDFLHNEILCRLTPGIGESLISLALSRDGRWLAVAGEKGLLEVWDVLHRKVVAGFWGEGPIYACALAFEGILTVAVGEAGGRVHFLRLEPAGHYID